MKAIVKKPPKWLCMLCFLPSLGLFAQGLTNDGALIQVQSGASLTIESHLTNEGSGQIVNDGLMVISGDLTNNSSQNLSDGNGNVALVGTAAQSIGGSQASRLFDLELDNAAGLILQQDIRVENGLLMTSGSVDLNGAVLTLGESAEIIGESDAKRISGAIGSVETTRDLGAPSGANIGNMGLELTSASSFGITRIIRSHASLAVGGGSSIERSFDIIPANNSNLDATLRMYYFPSELNGQDPATLSLFRLNNGATNWTPAGGISDVANNFVEQSGLDQMALWTLSADGTTSRDQLSMGVVQIFPNPLSSGEQLQIQGLPTGTFSFQLYDNRGRVVVQEQIQVLSSEELMRIPLPSLARGIYTLQLHHADFQPVWTKLQVR
ncbi:MAG: T9SS type A sorting domain-containing protein [Bacteroidota bacterium]